MTLENRLAELRNKSTQKFAEDVRAQMQRSTEELRGSGILDRALKAGDQMPSFALANTEGREVNSSELLKRGNLVVTFYRGVW